MHLFFNSICITVPLWGKKKKTFGKKSLKNLKYTTFMSDEWLELLFRVASLKIKASEILEQMWNDPRSK